MKTIMLVAAFTLKEGVCLAEEAAEQVSGDLGHDLALVLIVAILLLMVIGGKLP